LSKFVWANGCKVIKLGKGTYCNGQIRITGTIPQKSNVTRATENVRHDFDSEAIEFGLLLEILHMVPFRLVQDNQVLKMRRNLLSIRCAVLDNVAEITIGKFGIE